MTTTNMCSNFGGKWDSPPFLNIGKPQGKFWDFYECLSGVTGEAIANDIITQLSDWR